MDSGECFLVDWICVLLTCHIGRLTLVLTLVFMYKELTMGIYRKKDKLDGKLGIVTGGNTGIGLETARGLAERGARVILACRSKQRGEAAVTNIISSTGNKSVIFMQLDLLDLKSVRKFADDVAKKEKKVDILINNAAMAKHPKTSAKACSVYPRQARRSDTNQPPVSLPADKPPEEVPGSCWKCPGAECLLPRLHQGST
eukprot:TRINITY_DN21030_c0_g1_i1.p1 TRINITY_DN21030_c0_g1~~TRINITY_DN21030_c0_g1_i1.p1  ORF type:complete len:200 (-),score=45.96 TRINITY_DN21030_c0_g1_i1:331-930(-)